jgi:hypothetical protein
MAQSDGGRDLGLAPMAYALRVRLALTDGVRLGPDRARAAFSNSRRMGADVGELQPELQPLGDHSVPKYCDRTYELKEDQGAHRYVLRPALSCANVARRWLTCRICSRRDVAKMRPPSDRYQALLLDNSIGFGRLAIGVS